MGHALDDGMGRGVCRPVNTITGVNGSTFRCGVSQMGGLFCFLTLSSLIPHAPFKNTDELYSPRLAMLTFRNYGRPGRGFVSTPGADNVPSKFDQNLNVVRIEWGSGWPSTSFLL